jgi:hypothetical protein
MAIPHKLQLGCSPCLCHNRHDISTLCSHTNIIQATWKHIMVFFNTYNRQNIRSVLPNTSLRHLILTSFTMFLNVVRNVNCSLKPAHAALHPHTTQPTQYNSHSSSHLHCPQMVFQIRSALLSRKSSRIGVAKLHQSQHFICFKKAYDLLGSRLNL